MLQIQILVLAHAHGQAAYGILFVQYLIAVSACQLLVESGRAQLRGTAMMLQHIKQQHPIKVLLYSYKTFSLRTGRVLEYIIFIGLLLVMANLSVILE